jgi:hypothetical protein
VSSTEALPPFFHGCCAAIREKAATKQSGPLAQGDTALSLPHRLRECQELFELAFRDALRERTKSIPDNNHIRGGHDAA